MEAFIATVLPVAFNYPPRGWAFCNGQLMSVANNSALFALVGTMYGGDGRTTFGLPDLRGRVVVGSQGDGPGLQPVVQGQMAGSNNVTVIGSGAVQFTITSANLPPHTHPATMSLTGVTAATTLQASTGVTGLQNAAVTDAYISSTPSGGAGAQMYLAPPTAPTAPVNLGGISTTLSGNGSVSVGANTGGGQAIAAPVNTTALTSIMQPYTGLNYIIALEGIFPSRN